MALKLHSEEISVSLNTGPDIQDITSEFARAVKKSKINNGTLCANVIGSTGSLTTIEYEPGVIDDLKEAIDRLAPRDAQYKHELAWHDGNGHSHVQAAIMGPSITIQIHDGKLCLGTWQQAVVINHDNKARSRRIAITVIGQ